MRWEVDPSGPTGAGTWTFTGPNDYLFRALLLDIRNVIQSTSDLELREVLRDLEDMIDKDDVRALIAQIRDRYATYGEVGMTTENGKPLRPATVVKLWMYAAYHHRDLTKIRQLRALEPMQRMVHRQEFLEYLRNICTEVLNVRHLIDVAGHSGLLPRVEVPEWRGVPTPAAGQGEGRLSEQVALLALASHVATETGDLTVTWEEMERALAAYGGPSGVAMQISVRADSPDKINSVQLRVSKRPEGETE